MLKFAVYKMYNNIIIIINNNNARKSVESQDQNLAETIAQSVDKMNILFT